MRFTLTAVAVHEAFENYVRLIMAGGANNPNTYGPAQAPAHLDAVRYAEDPSLLGSGLETRTSRSKNCDVRQQPELFLNQVCP